MKSHNVNEVLKSNFSEFKMLYLKSRVESRAEIDAQTLMSSDDFKSLDEIAYSKVYLI